MNPRPLTLLIGILAAAASPALLAAHPTAAAHPAPAHSSHGHATGIVRAVRDSTRRYLRLSRAEAAGYGPLLGCASGDAEGAMGLHYANPVLVGDGVLDARRPEVLMYEPMANGRMRLVGVEFVVIAEAWDAANAAPPVLMGQLFHYEDSPNRYGLPAFYALHVWAWKNNPKGVFADWNPRVSCMHYAG